MVWSVTPEFLALDFVSVRRSRGRLPDRRYLLWPAFAYRVAAPAPRPRALDDFQRVVLALCRAGAHDVPALARRLHLAEELVRFIYDDLVARTWLDGRGMITECGLAALRRDAEVALDRMVTGYVFQDPFTETLWSRFTETLHPATLEHGDGKFPSLLLGTSGSPYRTGLRIIDHPARTLATPRPADILRALAAHSVADRRRRDEVLDPDDLPPPPPLAERRVSFIEEDAHRCHLLTYIHVDDSDREWRVCDPFGLGDSPRFKELIESCGRRSEPLASWLRKIDEKVLQNRLSDLRDQRGDLREAAERRLGERRRVVTGRLGEHLLDLTICLVESEYAHDDIRRLAEQAALYARKSLEALFSTIAERYSLRDVWLPLYRGRAPVDDPEFVAEYVNAAAHAVGLATPLPDALVRHRPNQIKAACFPDGGWSLRPRIVATILAARLDPQHPLRAASARQPRLCAELDILASLSSGELHDRPGRPRTPPPIAQLTERIHCVLDLFSV